MPHASGLRAQGSGLKSLGSGLALDIPAFPHVGIRHSAFGIRQMTPRDFRSARIVASRPRRSP
jgi:hypothetical protein